MAKVEMSRVELAREVRMRGGIRIIFVKKHCFQF